MESKTELDIAKNEVLKKIGQNMLLFQQMEHMLKFLVTNGKVAGYISELSANQELRTGIINRQTMGQLVGQLLENAYSTSEKSTEAPSEPKELHFSFTLRMEGDAVYYQNRKRALASIVDARNDLIHHLLPKFDPSSVESCLETERYLDQQREELLPEIKRLKGMINLLLKIKKELAEFLDSQDGKKQFVLPLLRQSRLVELLAVIAKQAARPEGWTLLSIAGNLVRHQAQEEMAALNETWGHKTLKGLILATELFDICEEHTEKGGVRVLYRPKANWELRRDGPLKES